VESPLRPRENWPATKVDIDMPKDHAAEKKDVYRNRLGPSRQISWMHDIFYR
jgi:hypothetical protein